MQTAAAILTPKNAPRAMERPPEPRIRLLVSASEAGLAGLGDRFRAILLQRERRQARRSQAALELQRLMATLLAEAAAEKISRRKLLAVLGISWGTWSRCLRGSADAGHWLPAFRAAALKFRRWCDERHRPPSAKD